MPDAMSFAKSNVEPDGIDCKCYDRRYVFDKASGQYVLSSIVLHVLYVNGADTVTNRDVEVSDGTINRAMGSVYDAARTPIYDAAAAEAYQPAYDEAIADDIPEDHAIAVAQVAARNAGNQAVIDAGITRGDAQATWSAAQEKVEANETPINALRMLSQKAWGKLIIEKAWAKEPV